VIVLRNSMRSAASYRASPERGVINAAIFHNHFL
jgi:hypothetical protein